MGNLFYDKRLSITNNRVRDVSRAGPRVFVPERFSAGVLGVPTTHHVMALVLRTLTDEVFLADPKFSDPFTVVATE